MLLNNNTVALKSQLENHISIGIDQGDSLWMMTAMDRSTGKYSRHCFRGAGKEYDCYEKVTEFVNSGRPVSVCYEAGRSGFTPARFFNNAGCNTRVLPVNKIKIISSGKQVKTDKIDSQFLAEINPLDESVPSVWVPTVHQECLRELPREEQRIKCDISRNNNRIISILQRWPIPTISTHNQSESWRRIIKKWRDAKAIPKLLPLSELRRIEMMVDELEVLEKHLKKWQELMQETEDAERKKSEENNEKYLVDVLRKYRGIGEVISRSFAWEVCDFHRFKNAKKFSSYLGLTPTPFSSGKIFREQGISKQGNPELRRLAIQLAWLWHHWQPDSEITKKWSNQLKKKGRQRKTAIVAMARQLMVALYRDIVKGEEIKGAKKNR